MSNKHKYKVILEGSVLEKTEQLPGEIWIAQNDTWNDFNYRVKCSYRLLTLDSSQYIEGIILVGFLPPIECDDATLNEFKNNYQRWESILGLIHDQNVKNNPRYFSLLPDMQSYRKVIDELGVDESLLFLNATNDLVTNKIKSKKATWYNEAIGSNVFNMAFMRGSEQFFAFHNADTILQGIEFENYSAISQTLNLEFKLDGFSNYHQLRFKFDNQSIIPKRINILIGKNGLGKSQTLQKFCRAALERPEPTSTKLVDINSKVSRPMINRIIALVTPGEVNTTFPGEYAKSQRLYYRRVDLSQRSSSSLKLGDLLLQLFRSESLLKEQHRWKIFQQALSEAFNTNEFFFKDENNYLQPLTQLARINTFSESGVRLALSISKFKEPLIKVGDVYHKLSSGQSTFFKFALQCCLYIENGTIILLDEPETHLHPNFIGEFVELLDYLLDQTGSLAIIATHSAYFVREVPREQVQVYKVDSEGRISISTPRLKTFGADVDSISQFIFDENIENRLTDKIFNRVKGMTFEEIEKRLGNELSMAALMEIKDRLETQ